MTNKNVAVMTSSNEHDWCTPQSFVDDLPFDFTLDVCATLESAKCEEYISPKMDALRADRRWPGVWFCNPPFDNIRPFTKKAVQEAAHSTGICLIPARTETNWFFHSVWKHAVLICFLGRRIHFTKPETANGGKTSGAPFPNVLAVFGELPVPEENQGMSSAEVKESYSRALSKIGTVISSGFGAIRLHGEKG